MYPIKKIREYRELSGLSKSQVSEYYSKSKQWYCKLALKDYVTDEDAKEMYQAINLCRCANKTENE